MHRRLWASYIAQCRDRRLAIASAAGRRGNWRRWHRDQEIVALLPMVRRIARDVRRMFAPHIDIEDLVQSGVLGLVKAAGSYCPSRGAFEPYAWFRVRGAIIDSQKRRTYIEESHISLDLIAQEHDYELPGRVDRDPGPWPDELAIRSQTQERLKHGIRALPRAERRMVKDHLAGASLSANAQRAGLPAAVVREKLAAACARVGDVVRGAAG